MKFQDVRVFEYIFTPRTAHFHVVMNSHVDVEKIRVLELLVARATLEHVSSGILVLFDFVDLERTRRGEALAAVRAHPHSEERKSQESVSGRKLKKRFKFKQFPLIGKRLSFLYGLRPIRLRQGNEARSYKRWESIQNSSSQEVDANPKC